MCCYFKVENVNWPDWFAHQGKLGQDPSHTFFLINCWSHVVWCWHNVRCREIQATRLRKNTWSCGGVGITWKSKSRPASGSNLASKKKHIYEELHKLYHIRKKQRVKSISKSHMHWNATLPKNVVYSLTQDNATLLPSITAAKIVQTGNQ